ncbi:unnamed protein product [Adineta steineri]|uniref:Uncharacterized protein n=1 Tax=Adineta steineri TaxID=433720 RepID=A0A818WKP8_9BILA|nr:unnamed protein product [Adineta steineri]CAF0838386.1 unnamed protein product [Adineta steineri]CAF3727599.1 unnamed protein product [Adineta steineri]CAF3948092.1 unnamed protein product [Adineta steineri]
MKAFCWSIFFVVMLLTAIDGTDYDQKTILSISSGTSGGFCRGYYMQSINITKTSMKLVALKRPHSPRTEYPTITKQYSYSSNQWEKLINLINPKDFLALPDYVDSPDPIDDLPVEWIQINWQNKEKRVSFQYYLIPGFEELTKHLRNLRNHYI